MMKMRRRWAVIAGGCVECYAANGGDDFVTVESVHRTREDAVAARNDLAGVDSLAGVTVDVDTIVDSAATRFYSVVKV